MSRKKAQKAQEFGLLALFEPLCGYPFVAYPADLAVNALTDFPLPAWQVSFKAACSAASMLSTRTLSTAYRFTVQVELERFGPDQSQEADEL